MLLVPSYFDFVKLKGFFRRKNAQVATISEYTEKKEAQRLRSIFEQKEVPVLMITERALVFQKIRVRFCRNLVLYAVPESPDIIESIEDIMNIEAWNKILEHRLRQLKTKSTSKNSEMSSEQLVTECKKAVHEGVIQNKNRSIVGLFSSYDGKVMERLVGTLQYK